MKIYVFGSGLRPDLIYAVTTVPTVPLYQKSRFDSLYILFCNGNRLNIEYFTKVINDKTFQKTKLFAF